MKRIALVGVVIVGSVLAGCGDDDASALSEEEFFRQGNAICAAGNEKLDAMFSELFGNLSPGEEPDAEAAATLFRDEIIPEIQKQIDGIGDLEPPEALAEEVEQLVDEAQAALDTMEQQAEDDPESIVQGQEEDPFADVNEHAREIGLTKCAEDGSEGGDEGGGDSEGGDEAFADIEPDPDHPYCDVEREVDAIFEEAFAALADDATEEEQQAAIQEVAKQIIAEELIEKGQAVVPDVIRADLEVLAASVREFAEGNFDTGEASDVAGARVDYFCGQENDG